MCLLALKGVSRIKIGHRNTPSKISKHFLPTSIILEEKGAFLMIFLAEIQLYCLLQEIETLNFKGKRNLQIRLGNLEITR